MGTLTRLVKRIFQQTEDSKKEILKAKQEVDKANELESKKQNKHLCYLNGGFRACNMPPHFVISRKRKKFKGYMRKAS